MQTTDLVAITQMAIKLTEVGAQVIELIGRLDRASTGDEIQWAEIDAQLAKVGAANDRLRAAVERLRARTPPVE